MVNLSSAVKKNTGSKHTRKELMNKSPIPWLVILVITSVGGGLFVYPDASNWLEKNASIKEMEDALPKLKAEKEALSLKKDELSQAFSDKAKPFIEIANQRFPVEIDATTITQIMEIYTILMQVNNRGNQIELTSLSISQPKNVDGLPFAETMMNLNIVVDREMLQEFISFIQTGEISNELENKVIENGGGETASIEFLKLNKLPVATINSLSLNENRANSEESSNAKEVFSTQIQVLFYSEPI